MQKNDSVECAAPDWTFSSWAWNILLITVGTIVMALGLKAIAAPHNFVSGGIFGTALLFNYATGLVSPGFGFFLLNIPLFILGWIYVSRRFIFYTAYAVVVATLAFEYVPWDFHIKQQIYAAIACGGINGAGCGLVLRSLGSNGGLDIMAVILNQKFNLGIGKFYFAFNLVLFSIASIFLDIDQIMASIIVVFVTSVVLDYVLSMFNQRKLVLIISKENAQIADTIIDMGLGATYLKGKGAYSGEEKDIIMTITNNVRLKRLEEIVFCADPQAIFIVENTFNVLGTGFSKRKIY
ncbi:MAG: YitT family protein [Desulfatibacillum sp.]|nr:YitT family protein [Desulfatibacillum sp.]